MTSLVIDRTEAMRLRRILEKCGVPTRSAFAIVVQMHNWEVARGLPWVVDRMKAMSSHLRLNGTKQKHNLVCRLGIKVHKDGSFVGPFRAIWRLASSGRRGFGKAFRALQIVGRWKAPSPGRSEYRAFADSISTNEPYKVPELVVTPEDMWLAAQEERSASFHLKLSTSASSVSPFFGEFVPRSDLDPEDHVRSLESCPNLVLKHYKFLNNLFALEPKYMYEEYLRIRGDRIDVVGGVKGLTKDRALKQRFIANPNLVLQAALTRLKSAIAGFLSVLPESCVYNQDKGLEWIKQKLNQGYRLHSVDLSKCSDNLPAREQFQLLRKLLPTLRADIDLFEDVSRSGWFCPFPDKLHWAKGQPLGLNPSFASFTTFHIMVIRSCGGDASNFRVIGDDVVFSNTDVMRSVLRAYQMMGVRINDNKSIFNSRRWAEFAGRLVDRFGALPFFKGKRLSVAQDPLGFIRQYGFQGVSLLPKRLRPMVYGVALLPRPFGLGKPEILDMLPPRVIHSLFVERFKAKRYAQANEAVLAWGSAFRAGLRREAHLPDGTITTQTLLGESLGVSSTGGLIPSELRLLEDHVTSWHDTPVEDVPLLIVELHRILESHSFDQYVPNEKEQTKAAYRGEAYLPISFIRKLWRRICSDFEKSKEDPSSL